MGWVKGVPFVHDLQSLLEQPSMYSSSSSSETSPESDSASVSESCSKGTLDVGVLLVATSDTIKMTQIALILPVLLQHQLLLYVHHLTPNLLLVSQEFQAGNWVELPFEWYPCDINTMHLKLLEQKWSLKSISILGNQHNTIPYVSIMRAPIVITSSVTFVTVNNVIIMKNSSTAEITMIC